MMPLEFLVAENPLNEIACRAFDAPRSKPRFRWNGMDAWMAKNGMSYILEKLKPVLAQLELAFVSWAINNRKLVVETLSEILRDDAWQSGNAQLDLQRTSPDWFKR